MKFDFTNFLKRYSTQLAAVGSLLTAIIVFYNQLPVAILDKLPDFTVQIVAGITFIVNVLIPFATSYKQPNLVKPTE